MSEEHVYNYLPYPFPYDPAPGQPVTAEDIAGVILPLLENVHGVLDALATTAHHEGLVNEHVPTTLSVLSEHVELVISLLTRLGEEQEA